MLGALAAAGTLAGAPTRKTGIGCGCAFAAASAIPPGSEVFKDVGSKLRVTDMKVFGVALDEKIPRADRPYVFVKIETNQGVAGWGEATLEGKASAAMACVNDLQDFIVGRPDAGGASVPVDVHRKLLPRGPVLGFEVNETALKKYPFQGTRPFPPAFHEDGSLASL
jgi:L-alanine-DL-glutamate epimerase-like enolase superfamily enzyme